jgi:hypothetical protein
MGKSVPKSFFQKFQSGQMTRKRAKGLPQMANGTKKTGPLRYSGAAHKMETYTVSLMAN